MDLTEALRRFADIVPNLTRALGMFTSSLPSLAAPLKQFVDAIAIFVASPLGAAIGQSRPVQAVAQAAQYLGRTQVGQFVQKAAGSAWRGVKAAGRGVAGAVAGLGPVAPLMAATAGLTLAFTSLGSMTEKLSRGFLESQRHLADHSAAMSSVFAQSDMRRVRREMKEGEDTAKSTGFLARQTDNLADVLQPITSLFTNIGNLLMGVIDGLLSGLLAPLSFIADTANKILNNMLGSSDSITVGKWLDGIKIEADKAIRDGDPRFKRIAPIMD